MFICHDNRSSGPESVKKIQLSEESTQILFGGFVCVVFLSHFY